MVLKLMGKKSCIYLLGFILISFLFLIILIDSTDYFDCEIYGVCQDPITFDNNTEGVNASDIWRTNIGDLSNVNATQFDDNGGDTLNLKPSWLTSFGNTVWCALTGCTMSGDIDMGGNNITNADTYFGDWNGGNVDGNVIIFGNVSIGGPPVSNKPLEVNGDILIQQSSRGLQGIGSLIIKTPAGATVQLQTDFTKRFEIEADGRANFQNNNLTTTGNITANTYFGDWNGGNVFNDVNLTNNDISGVENLTISNTIFLDVDHNEFIRVDASELFGGISNETIWLNHLDEHPSGAITFLVSANKSNSETNAINIMSQVGRNNSAGLLGNSWMVLTNNLTNNLTLYSSCIQIIDSMGKPLRVGCDTENTGPDFIVEDSIQAFGSIFADGGIRAEDFASFIMNGNDFQIENGSLHILTADRFVQGFNEGDEVIKFNEMFTGGLGSFTNVQTDVGNWIATASGFCNDGDCAESNGAGSGAVSMSVDISTSDLNDTSIFFVYSLVNLIGLGDFEVTANNNVGSGTVSIFSDSTSSVNLATQSINLPVSMEGQPQVTINFTCTNNAGNPNRQCFVDDIRVNGTATSTTAIEVDGFNSEICFGDGTRNTNNLCNNGLFYNASANQVNLLGAWNFSGSVGGVSHSALTNLEFGSSGHTFTSSGQQINFGSYNFNGSGDITTSGVYTGGPGTHTLGEGSLTTEGALLEIKGFQTPSPGPGSEPVPGRILLGRQNTANTADMYMFHFEDSMGGATNSKSSIAFSTSDWDGTAPNTWIDGAGGVHAQFYHFANLDFGRVIQMIELGDWSVLEILTQDNKGVRIRIQTDEQQAVVFALDDSSFGDNTIVSAVPGANLNWGFFTKATIGENLTVKIFGNTSTASTPIRSLDFSISSDGVSDFAHIRTDSSYILLDNIVNISSNLGVGGKLYVQNGIESNGSFITHSPFITCDTEERCYGIDFENKQTDWCSKILGNWVCDNSSLNIINKLTGLDARNTLIENTLNCEDDTHSYINGNCIEDNIKLKSNCEKTYWQYWDGNSCEENLYTKCFAESEDKAEYQYWDFKVNKCLINQTRKDEHDLRKIEEAEKENEVQIQKNCLIDRSNYWVNGNCLSSVGLSG